MGQTTNRPNSDETEQELTIISEIYQNFEMLEKSLYNLNMREPLIHTNIAKKCFADKIFDQIKKRQKITTI